MICIYSHWSSNNIMCFQSALSYFDMLAALSATLPDVLLIIASVLRSMQIWGQHCNIHLQATAWCLELWDLKVLVFWKYISWILPDPASNYMLVTNLFHNLWGIHIVNKDLHILYSKCSSNLSIQLFNIIYSIANCIIQSFSNGTNLLV